MRPADSRFHIDDENQGTVPQDKVIGRAFVVVWPLDRAALLSVLLVTYRESFSRSTDPLVGLLRRLGELQSLGCAVLVGTSRKSFIGRILAETRGGETPAPALGVISAAVPVQNASSAR